MQKIIFNIIIFSLPVLLLVGLLEYSLRNIPNDYSLKNDYLDENSNQLEVLFLGSSHAFRGVNPMYIQQKSYNASYVSQSLDIDYNILMKYEKNLDKLQFIVIPISYFSLFSNLKTSVESWRMKNYCIYYHLFISNQPSDYFELFNLSLKKNLKRIKSYYYNHENTITSDKNGYGKLIGTTELTSTGLIAAERHTKKNYQLLNDNLKTLTAIIDFSKKKGLKIIFYTPPAYITYTNHLDSVQLNMTFSKLNRITSNQNNIYYYNFLYDKDFFASDFYNADHLNEKGAEKLTKKLNNYIHLLIDEQETANKPNYRY